MTARYFTAAACQKLAGRLSERDWLVLRHVATLRFVSGSQLTRLCFADSADVSTNARAARRALLRLVRLGVLERLPRPIGGARSGSAGYVYHLGLGGHRLSVLRGLLPEAYRRRSHVPGTLFMRHTLTIAELHTRLIEGERSGRYELLELAAEPSCHRTYDGYGGQHILKPDTYVRLGIGPYEDSYFIEVDRATEGSRALTAQLERYIAYHRTGQEQTRRGVFPRVLWLTPSAARTLVIEDCAAGLPSDAQALFAVVEFDRAPVVMLEQI